MLSPVNGGGPPPKPVRVELVAPLVARVFYAVGKPKDCPVGALVVGPSGANRINPATVAVALADGSVVQAPLKGGSAWRLTDPGIDLSDPSLLLDGTVLP